MADTHTQPHAAKVSMIQRTITSLPKRCMAAPDLSTFESHRSVWPPRIRFMGASTTHCARPGDPMIGTLA